ncbi:NAD(P)/FAD-dependent oxidoreductase [Emticicia sp. BO119]|uniref:NAD(P)/FAD-dependent oxidoreductase n=1 Tax=Emticicia sp. BO119 TaxID=2757768 RepID=UPI0015F0EBA3|nr:NAD(P)/FAD-dependent oxidoreductase [Emticicia sp. BO119]MBA4850021.1 NAD(P)/FAD-dependent oxidoreductase [Emticicia sp. BO119]
MYDLIIIGGGAAGFFTAINAAEKNRSLKIAIIERGREVLQKVKVSGGGRCNVTHACFEPATLINYYPRGNQELLQPFQKFNPTHTIEWFESRGVRIKKEADGRMFPVSNSSQSIIDCFIETCYKNRIEIIKNTRVESIENEGDRWQLNTIGDGHYQTKKLMIATGSDTAVWKLLGNLGINLVSPVPSLFTFNIKDERIQDLMGISVENVVCQLSDAKTKSLNDFSSNGAILITHWGLSGPAILKLSAWAARELNGLNYEFEVIINWLGKTDIEKVRQHLHQQIVNQPKKNVLANPEFGLSIRLWKNLCMAAGIGEYQKWAETGKKHIIKLVEQLTTCRFRVNGKSTFKEEFVTAGGVDLSEIDFEAFSLKKYPNLYLAGEVLNIDAVTGGFNFQAAWTGAWIASQNL